MGARDPTMLPRALELYEALDDPAGQAIVLNNLGVDAYFAGNWTDTLDYWERFRIQQARTGDVAQSAVAANNVGEVLSDQGRLEPARALFEEAQAIWLTVRYPIGIALATSNLGRLATRDGRLADAERLLDEARAVYEHIGAADYVAETDSRQAERLLRAGDAEAAARLARDARARAVALGGHPVLLAALDRLLAIAVVQLGDAPAALALLRTSLAAARGASADFEEAQTAHVLAALRPPDAPALRERADELFIRLDVRNVAAVVPEYW
jgi:tetratricopeptide (TPR) repeat protein